MSSRPAEFYVSPRWKGALERRGLRTLDDWRALELELVERPNSRHGGVSGVRSFRVQGPTAPCTVFVKHQRGQRQRTLRGLVVGEGPFYSEYRTLLRFRQLALPVPEVVFFSRKRGVSGAEELLVLEGLNGDPLDELPWASLPPERVSALLRDVARGVARLHRAGWVHRRLYSKHVFVAWRDESRSYEVGFIDLESAHRHYGIRRYQYRDLECLGRRLKHLTPRQRLRFLREYLRAAWPDASLRAWARRVESASRRKQRRKRRR